MDGAKKNRNQYKLPSDFRSDRKSATGMSGDPKKGGRGGKFTWEGADGYADEDLDLIHGASYNNAGGRGGSKRADTGADAKKKAEGDNA